MVQFYLLSVLLNVVAGFSLMSSDAEPKGSKLDGIRAFFKDGTVRLVVGVLCFTVGFFKLLTVMAGDIPVVGDLVPAIAGMAAGFSLLLEFYEANSNVTTDTLEKLNAIFIVRRRIVGIVAMAVGGVHFLFPNVLFL